MGKTWVLKEFGRRYYENTAYFNFDENEEYKQFFEATKDVNRILQNLMLASGQKIVPEKTLIIFDESRIAPRSLNWENDIIPVEVKSEANTTSKSLKKIQGTVPGSSQTPCPVLSG